MRLKKLDWITYSDKLGTVSNLLKEFHKKNSGIGLNINILKYVGVSSLGVMGVPGVPWYPQILADQLTLSEPGETNYVNLITTDTPGFSDLPTALYVWDLTLSNSV